GKEDQSQLTGGIKVPKQGGFVVAGPLFLLQVIVTSSDEARRDAAAG
ncbi:hypothetical protein ACJ73_03716, partial [Blastomyces percursus]